MKLSENRTAEKGLIWQRDNYYHYYHSKNFFKLCPSVTLENILGTKSN